MGVLQAMGDPALLKTPEAKELLMSAAPASFDSATSDPAEPAT